VSLSDIFKTIAIPAGDYLFSAEPIAINSSHRLAKTKEGYPAILVCTQRSFNQKQRFTLQNLRVLQDIECQVKRDDIIVNELFTVIIFVNSDPDLQIYFLEISETLLNSLPNVPTERQVTDAIFRYIEIFKLLSESARKPALGLWAELFVIADSDNPAELLMSWHNNPTDTFDFQSGTDCLEVKATLRDQRIHSFSVEQLNPEEGIRVQVASIMTKQTTSGTTINELVEIIKGRLSDTALIEKLLVQVARTLGDTFNEATRLKFDVQAAKQSICYFDSNQIPKVLSIHVPKGVSNVRFQVILL
jgi:hypothetical protein